MAGDAVLSEPVSTQNSLQTGNFSGNLRNSAPKAAAGCQETAVLQRLLAEFPTRLSGKKF